MTTRSEREKAQKLNEQHQAILSKMLREEDNKYCADCEAKGNVKPWWNHRFCFVNVHTNVTDCQLNYMT